MSKGKLEEVFKQNSAIAGFILMFPTRAALVPVFERLLEVKLNCVDELACVAFYHHLVAAEVRSCEKLKAVGEGAQLQTVVLPDSENACFLGVVLPDT